MLLNDDEISRALEDLAGWVRRGVRIEKAFVFASFAEAIAFIVRLAFEAEARDHHPDLALSHRRLTIAYSTHSEGGITAKDVGGAQLVERLAAAAGAPPR